MHNQDYEAQLQQAIICADSDGLSDLLDSHPDVLLLSMSGQNILHFLMMNIITCDDSQNHVYLKMADTIIHKSVAVGIAGMFDDVNERGQTILHLAAVFASSYSNKRSILFNVASMLIADGANPMIRDNNNQSPRDMAPSFMDDVINNIKSVKENINPARPIVNSNPGEQTLNPVAEHLSRYSRERSVNL